VNTRTGELITPSAAGTPAQTGGTTEDIRTGFGE
jgi:hypothetical protein